MSTPRGTNYDVFLSFRGTDTRRGFVDCLFERMKDAGIRAFMDSESLHVGEVIGNELMLAIDHSKICMPVLSKGYASSKWCLLELEYIMRGCSGRVVWPILFGVSVDDVKLRTSLYTNDLETMEEKYKPEIVDPWRKSLIEVCMIKGWNLEEFQGQGKMINEIIQQVVSKTKKRYKEVPHHFLRIEDQIKAIVDLLDDQFDGVRFMVIHGMGGIGKTTLAKVIFNEVSSKFQGCSFLSDVRENSQKNGIIKLQEQILNDILGTSVTIYDADDGINKIRDRCSSKKVLLILDDVNDVSQIQKLAMLNWFERGSRVIITMRDSSIISNRQLLYDRLGIAVNGRLGDSFRLYEMKEMDNQHATTLFKRHAFGDYENTVDDDEDDLLQELVKSTGGLPLALEVVGRLLFMKSEPVWKETLEKLKKAPHKEVQTILMISYESLDDNEKEIFLDIACFFSGFQKHYPMYFWEASGLCPVSGMDALLHKSLIKIIDGGIWMHDQLIDLGREIVRKDRKSSRIWIAEDAFRLVKERKGTGDVLLLYLGDFPKIRRFKAAEFKDLINLRLLSLIGGNLVGDFSNCFLQLRWLQWISLPANFQPKNFSLPNLAMLTLTKANVNERWNGWNGLLGHKMKFLELNSCTRLTRTPDFSSCLGLERLVLRNCYRLIEIDDSMGNLEHLTHLEIYGSSSLKGLPMSIKGLKMIEKIVVTGIHDREYPVKFDLPSCIEELNTLRHLEINHVGLELLPEGIGGLKLLEFLSFDGCVNLKSLPEWIFKLESLIELNLTATGITEFPDGIESMKELRHLNVSHTNIQILPKRIGCLTKLEVLDVNYCELLNKIPREIGDLCSLRVLDLSNTDIRRLPLTVSRLSRLEHLDLDDCRELIRVKKLPASLNFLSLPYFSLQVLPDLSNFLNLFELRLSWNEVSCEEEVNVDWQTRIRSMDLKWIEKLHHIERLVITVPTHIFNFRQDDFISLSHLERAELYLLCSDLEYLSQVPPNLSGITLQKLPATTLDLSLYPNLQNLSQLIIFGWSAENIELRRLVNLHRLEIEWCESLVTLSISSCPKKLHLLEIVNCSKLAEIEGLDGLESLYTLRFFDCHSLKKLPNLSKLMKMDELTLIGCGSMTGMPKLPWKYPFGLRVENCGKMPNYYGPHDDYEEKLRLEWNKLLGRCIQSCVTFLCSLWLREAHHPEE